VPIRSGFWACNLALSILGLELGSWSTLGFKAQEKSWSV